MRVTARVQVRSRRVGMRGGGEPEMTDHRFASRPHVGEPYVHAVERRTASCDVARLIEAGVVEEIELGLFHATSG
ncbi:MAG: hypothetical protein JO100_03000 [Pseudonocardia sp.]|nr:hypothetical protein [Pseudonocardia sp.]